MILVKMLLYGLRVEVNEQRRVHPLLKQMVI